MRSELKPGMAMVIAAAIVAGLFGVALAADLSIHYLDHLFRIQQINQAADRVSEILKQNRGD